MKAAVRCERKTAQDDWKRSSGWTNVLPPGLIRSSFQAQAIFHILSVREK
jgi:hypothetical protein